MNTLVPIEVLIAEEEKKKKQEEKRPVLEIKIDIPEAFPELPETGSESSIYISL